MKLRVTNLTKYFNGASSGGRVEVLKDLSFTAEEGRFICIIGPSGCGKTTLLRIVSGLERPDSGRILLGDREVASVGGRIGYIFQESTLLPWRTVIKNVEFGLEMSGMAAKERKDKARAFLELVGLSAFEDFYPKELSGGMKQRAALAVSLIVEPRVLLMDEPFVALDSQTRNCMQEALLHVWERTRKTIVFVTHNVDEAVFLADEVICLTSRPSAVEKVLRVEVPRPRDRTSPEINNIRKEILSHLAVRGTKCAAGEQLTLKLQK